MLGSGGGIMMLVLILRRSEGEARGRGSSPPGTFELQASLEASLKAGGQSIILVSIIIMPKFTLQPVVMVPLPCKVRVGVGVCSCV